MKEVRATTGEWVPLGQAGIEKEQILDQVETLCHSAAFENEKNAKKILRYLVNCALKGTIPTVKQIAMEGLGRKQYYPGDSHVRNAAGALRIKLAEHYASAEAKPSEIRFSLPPRQYIVHAPPEYAGSRESWGAHHSGGHVLASILEPGDNAEVYQRVTVRGRIDALHPDLRAWLVVETPVGDHYPQCRVSRKSPEWQCEIRIGLLQWGSDEGAQYVIHLLVADADGDYEFYRHLKSGRDGFGPILPSDSSVLDSKRVTRRDIRPSGGA